MKVKLFEDLLTIHNDHYVSYVAWMSPERRATHENQRISRVDLQLHDC